MKNLLHPAEEGSDRDLVERCLKEGPEAFRFIVDRYKGLLCGLAFSFCGDVARSEDLAQETFLVAWRKLPELQSQEKLKPWLCSILRNLSSNLMRSQRCDPLTSTAALEEELAAVSADPSPGDLVMTREEEQLLWRVLQGLPNAYREPLVLFYRSGYSNTEVAQALELSEDTVRQRLSRGRALLGARIGRLVESGLRQSGPGTVFTAAVLASLPATATAGTAGAGVASSKSAGFLIKYAGPVAGLVSVGASFAGLWGHIVNTRSHRERRFIAWASVGFISAVLVWSILVAAGVAAAIRADGGQWTAAVTLCLGILAFAAPLDAYVIWMAKRQNEIRLQQPRELPLRAAMRGFKWSMYGSMTAMAFGSIGWLVLRASMAGDSRTALLLGLLAGVAAYISSQYAVRRPDQRAKAFVYLWWWLGALNLITVGWRWPVWAGPEENGAVGVGPVLLLVMTGFGAIRAGWYLKQRFLQSTTIQRDTAISLTVFIALMAGGLVLRHWVKSWDVPEIKAVQVLLCEVQPDRTMNFSCLSGFMNISDNELSELRSVSTDAIPARMIVGEYLQPGPVSVHRDGEVMHYTIPLGRPVLPGSWVFTRAVGQIAGGIKLLSNGHWEWRQRHWPAVGARHTLRVERYRFPAGARLISSDFAGATARRLPDERLELRISKMIPPDGNIDFRVEIAP